MTANNDANAPGAEAAAAPPRDETIVVIGGGTMGAGIAQSLIAVGYQVHLIESDEALAKQAFERIGAGLRRQYKRDPHPDARAENDLRALTVGTDYDAALDVDLVIEAVPEVVDIKYAVLDRASRAWPRAVIATNTSSMSITQLASAIDDPTRFVGTHFFNPVPRSELVEIVVAAETSEHAIDVARSVVGALGKDSIQVSDVPGFATSRLGVMLGIEAIRMVEEGVASAQDIDKGMRLGYRLPMGPLELTDLVGLDVRLSVAQYLADSIGARFEPPQLLRDKVARGELGSKTGHGFYLWENGRKTALAPSGDQRNGEVS